MGLNVIVSVVIRLPQFLVLTVLSLTVANTDSIGCSQHFTCTFPEHLLQRISLLWSIQFKNILICLCGVLLILIVDLGRSLSTDYTTLFSFHTPDMIIAPSTVVEGRKLTFNAWYIGASLQHPN